MTLLLLPTTQNETSGIRLVWQIITQLHEFSLKIDIYIAIFGSLLTMFVALELEPSLLAPRRWTRFTERPYRRGQTASFMGFDVWYETKV